MLLLLIKGNQISIENINSANSTVSNNKSASLSNIELLNLIQNLK